MQETLYEAVHSRDDEQVVALLAVWIFARAVCSTSDTAGRSVAGTIGRNRGPAPALPLLPIPEPEPFLDFEEPPNTTYKTKNSSSRVERSLNIRPLRAKRSDYGFYGLDRRYHSDQSPFVLDQIAGRSFASPDCINGAQVSGQPGGDKRFGTIRLSMHGGDNEQPKISSII